MVKPGGIGDIVMCLPAVEAYRVRWPGTHVTWVADERAVEFVALSGCADRIVPVALSRIREGGFFAQVSEVLRCWVRLRGARFDEAFVPFRDWRYRLLVAVARIDAYSGARAGRGRAPFVPGRHHTDEFWRFLQHEEGPDVARLPASRLNVENTPAVDALLGGGTAPGFVVLCVGGERNRDGLGALRRWPTSMYAALARRFIESGRPVVVTGTAADATERGAFEGTGVRDLIGRVSLREFCEVLQRSRAVVAHDGGALHLAGLMGAPTLGLFGPTDPAERAPRKMQARVLWGGETLSCRPCYDGRTYARCSHNACMHDLSVDLVYAAACELLGAVEDTR